MVARTVPLPNIRRLIVPDEGFLIAECDLERADLQVVVWEADDAELKQMLRAGVNIHSENARLLFGPQNVEPSSDPNSPYARAKRGVHAANYGVSARTLAGSLGVTERQAQSFLDRWFGAHPGIRRWHERTQAQLERNQTITNPWGYNIVYFGRCDSAMLRDALAWQAQSTVACTINRALVSIAERLPWVQLLLQVHDSLVMQFPMGRFLQRNEIRECVEIPIPYSDPLTIPCTLKVSAVSWGAAQRVPWL